MQRNISSVLLIYSAFKTAAAATKMYDNRKTFRYIKLSLLVAVITFMFEYNNTIIIKLILLA